MKLCSYIEYRRDEHEQEKEDQLPNVEKIIRFFFYSTRGTGREILMSEHEWPLGSSVLN